MLKIRRLESLNDLEKYLSISIKQSVFQNLWYLEIFAEHFSQSEEIIILGIFKNDQFLGFGAFEDIGNKVVFLGMKPVLSKEEVTDYGDISLNDWSGEVVKQVWQKICQWFQENSKSTLQLDYVREDSSTYKILKNTNIAGISVETFKQEVSPYIDLPNSWDDYLSLLDRKKRKELKRKMNRLDTLRNLHVCSSETLKLDFKEFIKLHRISDPKKHKFMSDKMKSFFWDLLVVRKNYCDVNLCFLKIDGKYVSSIMSFEFEDKIFAYNSGYDPVYDFYSVGLLLHAFKIKDAIEKKKRLYDFLRGGERYKYDLGAKTLQLYKIIISRQ